MTFLVYCLILTVGVYLAPALAVFPRLTTHPRLFALTPILSTLFIYLMVTVLIACNLYQRDIVIGISILLTMIASYRFKQQKQSLNKQYWSLASKRYYFLHALLLLPFFIKLATHGFERGDEIYSWNFWAIQHYLSIPIDFSHTGAAYPQLLPKCLSYCYKILGNIELQLPIKGLLILFPYAMLNAMASLLSFNHRRMIIFYTFSLVFILFGCHIARFFDNGYADPLMTSSLIVSVICYWQYYRWMKIRQYWKKSLKRLDFVSLSYLFFAYLTAMTAFLAKQPGLLWVVSLSVLTLYQTIIQSQKTRSSVFVPVFLIGAISFSVYFWLRTEGYQFQNNGGVIGLSKADRDILEQLMFSFHRYLLLKPALLILFISALWLSRKDTLLFTLSLLFFIPGVLLWFIFGAYQLRLGQHLIAFAWFIVLASCLRGKSVNTMVALERFKPTWVNKVVILNYPKTLISLCFSVSVVVSFFLWYKACYIERQNVSLYQGGRVVLNRYFGTDSDWIYQNLYKNSDLLLWVPSRYLYGLFYPHTQLTMPDYQQYTHYDESALLDELLRKKPDYVFAASTAIVDGTASTMLVKLVEQYPAIFEVVAQAPNRFDFITYRFNHHKLSEQAVEAG